MGWKEASKPATALAAGRDSDLGGRRPAASGEVAGAPSAAGGTGGGQPPAESLAALRMGGEGGALARSLVQLLMLQEGGGEGGLVGSREVHRIVSTVYAERKVPPCLPANLPYPSTPSTDPPTPPHPTPPYLCRRAG